MPALWTTLRTKSHVLRYLAVGAVCTLFQLALLHLLHWHIRAEIANAVAFLISTQLNFTLSYHWTWASRRTGRDDAVTFTRRLVLFNLTAGAGLLVNSAAFAVALHLLSAGVTAAALQAVLVSTCFSYVLGSRLTFAVGATALDDGALGARPGKGITMTPQGLALFLPAYNEAANLPSVVGDAVAHLRTRQAPFTVIVVNDGSSDHTDQVVADLTHRYPEVSAVHHDVNRGYGAALRTGLHAGVETGMPYVAFCDSDGQFNPADVERLIAFADDGADLVIGYRAHRADNAVRVAMGHAWHRLGQLIVGYRSKDVDCGFKLFRTSHLRSYLHALSGEYATISPEILARAKRAGGRIEQVSMPHYPRLAGQPSGANFKVIISSITGLLALRRRLDAEEYVIDVREVIPTQTSTSSATTLSDQELSA